MGITQHAADALTDITFVEMKPAGTAVTAGGTVGEVESVKTSSEIYVPCAATVSAVNDAAHKDPSLLNSDPFGKGWLVRLASCDLSKAQGLMDAATYDQKNGH
jgi:glycine cleavage system H protein